MQQYILDEAAKFANDQLKAVGRRVAQRAQREVANYATQKAIEKGQQIHEYILDNYKRRNQMPRTRLFNLYYKRPGMGRHYTRSGYGRTSGSYRNLISSRAHMSQKFHDRRIAFTGCYSDRACYMGNIAVIAQGASPQERIGREVKIKSLDVRGDLTLSGGTGTTDVRYKMVFFIDTQYNGSGISSDQLTGSATGTADWLTVFNDDTASGTPTADNYLDLYKDLDQGGRFRIIKSLTGKLHREDPVDNVKRNIKFHINFRRPLKITYDAGTTAGTVVRDNAISWMLITDAALASGTPLEGHMLTRLRYQD